MPGMAVRQPPEDPNSLVLVPVSERAEFVQTVLDALSAPAGADDDRSYEQRYHDALQEAIDKKYFDQRVPIAGAEGVKWARLLAQVVYYFAGYFQATKGNAER